MLEDLATSCEFTKALHGHGGAVDVPHQLHRENFSTAIRPIAEATVVQHRGLLGMEKNGEKYMDKC